jgi:hypothetical protein
LRTSKKYAKIFYRAEKYLFFRRLRVGAVVHISGSAVRVLAIGLGSIFFNYLENPFPGPIQTHFENIDEFPTRR